MRRIKSHAFDSVKRLQYCSKVMQTVLFTKFAKIPSFSTNSWPLKNFDNISVNFWGTYSFDRLKLLVRYSSRTFMPLRINRAKIHSPLWILLPKFLATVQSSQKDLVEFVVCNCVMWERKQLKSVPLTESCHPWVHNSLCLCLCYWKLNTQKLYRLDREWLILFAAMATLSVSVLCMHLELLGTH